MNLSEVFEQAIRDDPADDTPRLVYADWLEENATDKSCPPCYGGGIAIHMTDAGPNHPMPPCGLCRGTGRVPDGRAERASFIRCQIELAGPDSCVEYCPCNPTGKMPNGAPCPCPPCALRRRERELLVKHGFYGYPGSKWVDKECPALWKLSDRGANFVFRRGFVTSVTLTCDDFLKYAGALFACCPIEKVTLTDKRPAHSDSFDGGFVWVRASPHESQDAPHWVPPAIYDLMPLGVGMKRELGITVNIPTEQKALDVLSAACRKFGRAAAKGGA